ncbi:MAG: hypothetical protein WC541_08320 [Dehalococcoidia bacterium]
MLWTGKTDRTPFKSSLVMVNVSGLKLRMEKSRNNRIMHNRTISRFNPRYPHQEYIMNTLQ